MNADELKRVKERAERVANIQNYNHGDVMDICAAVVDLLAHVRELEAAPSLHDSMAQEIKRLRDVERENEKLRADGGCIEALEAELADLKDQVKLFSDQAAHGIVKRAELEAELADLKANIARKLATWRVRSESVAQDILDDFEELIADPGKKVEEGKS